MNHRTNQCLWIITVLIGQGLFIACGHLDNPQAEQIRLNPTNSVANLSSNSLINQAYALLGVPYVYGGASPKKGMDCSGFIYFLYRQQGMIVPRTTAHQYRQSQPVSLTKLIPGDLVFFRLKRKISHVGLYIGDGMFIHSPSTGKQVQRSHLGDPFWRQRWVRGGRFKKTAL